MNKRQVYYILSIVVMVILTVIFAVTFAYGSRPTVTGNTNVNVTIYGNATLSYDRDKAFVQLEITDDDLSITNATNNYNSHVNSDPSNINVTLTTDSNQFATGLSCSYDLVYTPTVAYVPSAASVAANLNELTLVGVLNGVQQFEIPIAGSNAIILYSTSISTSSSVHTVEQKWSFYTVFYNLNVDQNDAGGQVPYGTISITNSECGSSSNHPTSYWFPTTYSVWNNSLGTYVQTYTHPTTGGPVQISGSATGHRVYIGQNSVKYYACMIYQNHELCFSQPYTQYGLEGHTIGNNFTSNQQTAVKQAIYQAFVDAGITIDINNDCGVTSSQSYCSVDDIYCGIDTRGYVACRDYNDYENCLVDANEHAACEKLN